MGKRRNRENDRAIECCKREIQKCKDTIASTRWPHVAEDCRCRIRDLRRDLEQLQDDRRDSWAA